MDKEMRCTPGTCPKCGSEELDYGCLNVQDAMVYYSFSCPVCRLEAREWYDLSYASTTITDEGVV